MNEIDIRWQQRFQNFQKALGQLESFMEKEELNKLEEQGLIKAFEYTFELAWKTLQDLLKHKGYLDVIGPRPVIQKSFQDGYITEGAGWIRMQKSRNLSSHTYNEDVATAIIKSIREEYIQYFHQLNEKLLTEK